MTAAMQLSASAGCAAACRARDLPRASFYRARAGSASIRLAAPSRENWPLVLVQLRL
jgi:hypothetical protein